MSATSRSPIQMPVSPLVTERLQNDHEQYTPLADNTFGQELMTQGLTPNADGTGFDFVYCNDGASACTAADASYLKLDLMEGSAAFSTELGSDTVGAAFDPTLSSTDEKQAMGVKGSLAASKTLGADKLGVDVSLAAMQTGEGKLTPLPDGRFAVSGGHSTTVDIETGMNLGVAAGGVGAGGSAATSATRIFTAEEVAHARSQLDVEASEQGPARKASSVEVAQLLLASGESAADFELGESASSSSSGRFSAKGKGTVGVVAGASASASDGRSTRFERTEAGLVITHTSTDAVKGALTGGLGVPFAKTERKEEAEQSTTTTYTLTLDPEADGDLIRQLESLSGDSLQAALEANGATVEAGGSVRVATTDALQCGPVAGKHATARQLTYDQDGFTGSYTDTTATQATLFESDLASSSSAATYRNDVGLSLTETVDKQQVLGRTVSEADLRELVAMVVADPAAFEREGTPDIVGEPVAWQALSDELQTIATLPAEQQGKAASVAIAHFVTKGHDLAQVDRLLGTAGLGQVEQWPTSVPRGGERLAALEAEEAPTEATLTELDALSNEVSAATDFTVATAKAETLERIAHVRATKLDELLAGGDVDAEELAFEGRQAALRSALGRCAAHRSEEGAMYAGVGTEDNLMTYQRLQQFYTDWAEAVRSVRTVCGEMGLDEGAWMVSANGENRVAAYEPTVERAQRLHAEHGGMAGDFESSVEKEVTQ